MLFFVFLSCIPIMVIVFQVKKLNGQQSFESMNLLGALIVFKTTHFIIVIITNSISLLFREEPASVFQFYFHSRKFLKALPLMLLLS